MAEVLNESQFTEALTSNDVVLVDFFATWCPPCKLLSPTVEKLAKEYDGRARVVKVNADDSPKAISEYRISGLPTLVAFKGGKEVKRLVGNQSEGVIRKTLDALL